jgi:hypothetical protein
MLMMGVFSNEVITNNVNDHHILFKLRCDSCLYHWYLKWMLWGRCVTDNILVSDHRMRVSEWVSECVCVCVYGMRQTNTLYNLMWSSSPLTDQFKSVITVDSHQWMKDSNVCNYIYKYIFYKQQYQKCCSDQIKEQWIVGNLHFFF